MGDELIHPTALAIDYSDPRVCLGDNITVLFNSSFVAACVQCQTSVFEPFSKQM